MDISEQVARWLQKNTDYAECLEWDDFGVEAQEGFRISADQILSLIIPELTEVGEEENPYKITKVIQGEYETSEDFTKRFNKKSLESSIAYPVFSEGTKAQLFHTIKQLRGE